MTRAAMTLALMSICASCQGRGQMTPIKEEPDVAVILSCATESPSSEKELFSTGTLPIPSLVADLEVRLREALGREFARLPTCAYPGYSHSIDGYLRQYCGARRGSTPVVIIQGIQKGLAGASDAVQTWRKEMRIHSDVGSCFFWTVYNVDAAMFEGFHFSGTRGPFLLSTQKQRP